MVKIDISAIVCTYNREKFIIKCLKSLINQTYNNYEIIVVDDGSKDHTPEIIATFQKNLANPALLRYIRHKKNKGLAAARNTGVANAKAAIIAFTDDDCIVNPDWLNAIYRYHMRYEDAAAIGGLVLNGYPKNIIAKIGQAMVTHQLLSKRLNEGDTTFLVGNNQSYKKKFVQEVGLFEEAQTHAEEHELQIRLLRKGYRMLYIPEITVIHFQRSTLKSFIRQYFRYGIEQYKIYLKNRCEADDFGKGFRTTNPISRLFYKAVGVSHNLDNLHEKLLGVLLVYISGMSLGVGLLTGKMGRR